MNIAYLNNQKVEPQNQISLYNPSFLYGINCFEGIRGYYSESQKKLIFFDLDQHLSRLYKSADELSMCLKVKKNDLQNQIIEITEKEKIKEDIYIRVTFFISEDTNWADRLNISQIISIRSLKSELGSMSSISLGISKYRRIQKQSMPPNVKARANYLKSRYAL